jgi:phosphatidylinositol alpha-mannosyltransferase
MGAPALVKEGVSWREVRLRALHSTPVSLGRRRPSTSHSDV